MSRLSKNIIYNLVGQGGLLLVSFIAVKFIFQQLGNDIFGLIYFVLTLNLLLRGILETGVGLATTRELSRFLADDPAYIHKLIQTTSLIYWGAYLCSAAILYLNAPLLAKEWLHLETLSPNTAALIIQILGPGMLLVLPNALYASLFRGLQRMEFNNLIDVITNLLQQTGIVAILLVGGGVLPVIVWLAISFSIGTITYLLTLQRFFSWKAFLPIYHVKVARRNRAYVAQMLSISLFSIVHVQADKLVVSKLLSVGMFGYYSFAYGLVGRVQLFRQAISTAAFPTLTALFQAGDHKRLLRQYHKLNDTLCFGTIFFFAIIPFGTKPLFQFIFNQEVAELILWPIILLTLGSYLNTTLTMPYIFSLSVGRPDITAQANFYALFIILPLTVLLTYYYGLTGAAASWTLYNLFMHIYAMPKIAAHCLKLSIWSWYAKILQIVAITGVMYGLGWLGITAVSNFTMLNLALAYGFGSLMFLISAYWLIGPELRENLFQLSKMLKRRSIPSLIR